jgi:hypothetical protein
MKRPRFTDIELRLLRIERWDKAHATADDKDDAEPVSTVVPEAGEDPDKKRRLKGRLVRLADSVDEKPRWQL